MRDWWFATALMLSVLMAACDARDAGSQEEDSEPSAGVALQLAVVETPNGRWRVAPEIAEFQATSTPPNVAAVDTSMSLRSDDQVHLLIETQLDMQRFLTSEVNEFTWDANVFRTFQAVPGVPNDPRYADPKFDRVRNAFTPACIRDAQQYTASVFSVYASQDLVQALQDESVATFSNGFESNCLRKLQDVPLAVRQVVGVLRMSGGILCSATVIGEREVLTARHCFFDADTGTAHASWNALAAGTISFFPAVAHNGRSEFSVRKLDDATNASFEAYDDAIRLRVVGGRFSHWASQRAAAIGSDALPVPAWLVGSNALLGDVRSPRHPFEFVRGAAPEACALLEVTNSGCIYHTCQAGASTSGAGVLVPTIDGVQLYGVHKGPVARAAKCEAAPPLSLNMNVAALYPKT